MQIRQALIAEQRRRWEKVNGDMEIALVDSTKDLLKRTSEMQKEMLVEVIQKFQGRITRDEMPEMIKDHKHVYETDLAETERRCKLLDEHIMKLAHSADEQFEGIINDGTSSNHQLMIGLTTIILMKRDVLAKELKRKEISMAASIQVYKASHKEMMDSLK